MAAVLFAAGPAPAAAANREIFLTTVPPPEAPTEPAGPDDPAELPPDEDVYKTGPSGQAAATSTPASSAEPVPTETDTQPAAPRLGPGGELRVFGGMHQPTFGVALGFDWAFRRAAIGVQADYAAWLDTTDFGLHPGAIHLAVTGQHRIPLHRLTLRQRLAIGPAILLADLGTHRAGSTGLFFEAAPLGLEVHTRLSRLTFVLDAFSLAISAPALGPDPATQIQYRATIGLRF